MSDHPYGVLSLTPPLAAIALAIVTRRVVPSLFCGILAGVLIMGSQHRDAYGGSLLSLPAAAIASTFRDHLWPTLIQEEKLAVFAFTMLMGAMVGIIQKCGGMRGMVDAVAHWANNIRRAQLAAWMLGLVVFFDDYANTMLLGGTLRPLFDRLKISREKLAYLVDSTAAPVSGLALVSTWVAGEIGYVRDGLSQLDGVDWDPLQLFLGSIPYRFYVLLALVMVPLSAWMRRDFKTMAVAERRARNRATPMSDPHAASEHDAEPAPVPKTSHWLNAVLPIVITVAAIVAFLCQSGLGALAAEGASDRSWMNIFGNADTFMSLLWGSLIGAFVAAGLAWGQRLLSLDEIKTAAMGGALHMSPALAILWLASVLSQMTGNDQPAHPLPGIVAGAAGAEATIVPVAADGQSFGQGPSQADAFPFQQQRLYTGDYLGRVLENRMPLWLAPTVVFMLSGAIAFATGTSWGTMGIVMPLAIGAAYRLLSAEGPPSPEDPVLLGCIGGVLAGAIFGDHCSPISDTTVMSSQASGCSHVEHVRTQLPYALCVGAISIFCGALPVGLGVSPWLLLPIGFAAMVASLLLFAQPTPSADDAEKNG